MSAYKLFLRPLLFRFDPEKIHSWTLRFVPAISWLMRLMPRAPASLATEVAGMAFPSPVGLAAGFDKDAQCFRHMFAFGFGAVEVGTVTPQPQYGNPVPRIYRLPRHRAVINRMGFPNDGLSTILGRLQSPDKLAGPLGVNIGANKDSPDRIADYVAAYRAISGVADYVTVNVSSPNTPNLRALEQGGGLRSLISALDKEIDRIKVPIFLKVSPDLTEDQVNETCSVILNSGISAVIIGNTTLFRPEGINLDTNGTEAGGLSGEPLRERSLIGLRSFYSRLQGRVPLVSVGGISSADDVFERLEAGAALVQLYTGLVFEGPMLVHRINSQLHRLLKSRGFSNLAEVIGSAHSDKTRKSTPATNFQRSAEPAFAS